MTNNKLVAFVVVGFAVGLGVAMLATPKSVHKDANVQQNIVNFSNVSNVSFKADSYVVTSGAYFAGVLNNQACLVDPTASESDISDATVAHEDCSALDVRAELIPSGDIANYLTSNSVTLFDDALGLANFAIAGTLSFRFNSMTSFCDGLYISQSTIDNENVWAIYDSYGNSIVPEYTDDEAVALQCKNGAVLTLSGDDLPNNLAYANSFEVVGYTVSQ